ncbi:MAG: EI24 domain-containing protein [Rickettsiales bacterium]
MSLRMCEYLWAFVVGFTLFMMGTVAVLRSFDVTGGGIVEWFLDIALSLGASVGMWFLLPVLVPAIAAFFQEPIANSIEKRDYPEFMPPAVERPLLREIWEDTKFVLLILICNILFFIVYFIPIIGQFAYYSVNGYLIGREFFETAAARHIGKKEAKALRKQYPTPAFLCGVLIVFCTNVPLLNLFAPFIGVAIMVHLFHLLPKAKELLRPAQQIEADA